LTTLGTEEADIKLSQFHSFIVNQKNNFTIAKISESFYFLNQKKNLLKEMAKTKQQYDDSLISEKEYKAKQEQQKKQLEVLDNPGEIINSNFLSKNFYFIFYEIKPEETLIRIENIKNDLHSIGISAKELNEFETINFIKNIYNPLHANISQETIKENSENLDEIFRFDEIKFKKDHISINDELLLSIQSVSDYPVEVDNY
jgi:hypothetical protein